MSIRSEFDELSPSKLIEALSTRIYEAPLSIARDRLNEIAEPLRVAMLVLDFDTELCMNGILGFLENSTGLYFPETIEAFDKIGASETVSVLRAIEKTLKKYGITTSRLRGDFVGTREYQITTFRELHGDLGTLPNEVEQDAQRLYLYAPTGSGEPIWTLLEAFVERNRPELLAEIARVAGD
jgi:hypothetical protein